MGWFLKRDDIRVIHRRHCERSAAIYKVPKRV
jgi:hypothetical protein